MSFWGLSDAGKEAKGFPREYANWNFGQYKDWLATQNQFKDVADPLVQQGVDYWTQLSQQGGPSVPATRATGQEILDVDPTIQAMTERAQGLMSDYGNLTPAGTTAENMRTNLYQSGEDINRTGDLVSGQISDTATRMMKRNEASSQDIIQNILDTYGALGEQTNETFWGLRDANKLTYEDLLKASKETYGNAYQELEKMRPGGEFAAATAARSFAPEAARVMQQLRRSGVDPTSVEGSAALGGVGEAKGRAMDDAFGRMASEFADKSIGLGLSKFGAESGIKTDRLGREIGLATGQLETTSGLGKEQLAGVTGEKGKATSIAQAIDEAQSTGQIGNLLNSQGLRSDWWDKMNQTSVGERGMQREDLGIKGGLTENLNKTDLTALQLKLDQFGLGKDFLTADQATKDKGMAQLMGISDQQYQNMFNSALVAQKAGGSALNAYNQAFELEAANAGWGKKLIANLGMVGAKALLTAYAPWALPILGAVEGTATGG